MWFGWNNKLRLPNNCWGTLLVEITGWQHRRKVFEMIFLQKHLWLVLRGWLPQWVVYGNDFHTPFSTFSSITIDLLWKHTECNALTTKHKTLSEKCLFFDFCPRLQSCFKTEIKICPNQFEVSWGKSGIDRQWVQCRMMELDQYWWCYSFSTIDQLRVSLVLLQLMAVVFQDEPCIQLGLHNRGMQTPLPPPPRLLPSLLHAFHSLTNHPPNQCLQSSCPINEYWFCHIQFHGHWFN